MRVTAFLGAGSSLEIGGPSANELTTCERQALLDKKRQVFWDRFRPSAILIENRVTVL